MRRAIGHNAEADPSKRKSMNRKAEWGRRRREPVKQPGDPINPAKSHKRQHRNFHPKTSLKKKQEWRKQTLHNT